MCGNCPKVVKFNRAERAESLFKNIAHVFCRGCTPMAVLSNLLIQRDALDHGVNYRAATANLCLLILANHAIATPSQHIQPEVDHIGKTEIDLPSARRNHE